MIDEFIALGNQAYENAHYVKACEFYMNAFKMLEQTENQSVEIKESKCSLLMCIASSHIAVAFAYPMLPTDPFDCFKEIQATIIDTLDYAQDICDAMPEGVLQYAANHNLEVMYQKGYVVLRNAYWSRVCTLQDMVQEKNPPPQKNIYLLLLQNLKYFIDYTHKISTNNPAMQLKIIQAAEELIAEIYDCLGNWSLNYAKLIAALPHGGEFVPKLLQDAIVYGRGAVDLWTATAHPTEIPYLQLNYLHMLGNIFESSHDQCHLSVMSDYIDQHFNRVFKDNSIINEIIGHKLMVALNRCPINHAKALHWAKEFLAIRHGECMHPSQRYFYNLAINYLAEVEPTDQKDADAQQSLPPPAVLKKRRLEFSVSSSNDCLFKKSISMKTPARVEQQTGQCIKI